MRLHLQALDASSFKSFDKLQLDLSSYRPGLHFWRGDNRLDPALGSNGAGKSTVWDAICWCLYGRTPSGLKAVDVRTWHVKAQTVVAVQVNGVVVQRTAGPNNLTMDGRDVAQADVDKLLGLEADTFFHCVVLGQGQPLFYDLSPRAKLDLFSTVLNLDRWDTRADAAKDKVHRLDKLQARLQGELTTMQNRSGFVDKELEQLKQRAGEWSDTQMRKLDSLERELKTAKDRIDKLSVEHDTADLAYDGAMLDLKLLDKDHDRLLQQIHEAHIAWEKHDIGIAALREERDQLDFDLTMRPEKCDKCGQPLGDKDYKRMRNRMLDRLDDLEADIKADKQGPALLARVQELKQEEQRMLATADGLKQRADKAKATLDMVTPLLAELRAFVSARDATEQELRDAPNPYHEQLQARRKERQRLKANIEELEQRLQRLAGQIERTKFWVKGFRDVRLYVVDALMQELEMATNAMLPEVGLVDWQVRYDIERETKKGTAQRGLNVTILSPDNEHPVRWESWSGGEGQRLRLVGALSFADVLLRHSGVQTSLEVLDEPTQHLSAEGVRDLVEFLQARAKVDERALFYVDHTSVESSHFDSVTTVVKDRQGSWLAGQLSTA